MAPTNNKNSEFPERLTLALNYADESSARIRRIVLFIQIAAVLVLAALWQETDHNWLQLRLNAAHAGIRFLTCEPQAAYLIPPVEPQPETDARTVLNRELAKGLTQMNREEIEDAYDCAAHPLTNDERSLARGSLEGHGYSLPEAKKYLSDLEQIKHSRMLGVGVPVLGTFFDINELSLIGGLAFCILMSWFYFALHGQRHNICTIFTIARHCEVPAASSQAENEKKDGETSPLKAAYGLLRMTQILSVVPSEDIDDRDVSFRRRLTRLPHLILWTPAVAQLAVLINDIQTMPVTDYLSPLVNRAETAIAVYLFVYILYQTVKCFELMKETDREWIRAWNEFSPKSQQTGDLPNRFSLWLKDSRQAIAFVILALAVIVHIIDEWRPSLPSFFHRIVGSLVQGWTSHVSSIVNFGRWLTAVMLLLVVVLSLLGLYRRKPRVTLRLAWTFTMLALVDVMIHNLRAVYLARPVQFRQQMEGFYSSPLLVIAVLFFLFSLRHDRTTPVANAPAPPVVG